MLSGGLDRGPTPSFFCLFSSLFLPLSFPLFPPRIQYSSKAGQKPAE